MAKYFSFVAENVNPLSQNHRTMVLVRLLRRRLTRWYNQKPGNTPLPLNPLITNELQAKAFYIHRVRDDKDADNISKPLWDSLNNYAYDDDRRIKYLETLKINRDTSDIFEVDYTNMDIPDLQKLLDFLDNNGGQKERFLYIEISDYESKKVRF